MTNNDAVERIEEFKHELSSRDPLDIARRHIVFGDCAAISPDEYFDLRNSISEQYCVHPNEVVVVGSGKLGFSIAPTKRYRLFGSNSDLDVAIVSNPLFEVVWKDVHRYFSQGGYWEGKSEFIKYLFRGWIRPDKLPPDQKFDFRKDWWEFFDSLSASRRFSRNKIRGAIYQSWHFLESYHTVAIAECAKELRNDEEADHGN